MLFHYTRRETKFQKDQWLTKVTRQVAKLGQTPSLLSYLFKNNFESIQCVRPWNYDEYYQICFLLSGCL